MEVCERIGYIRSSRPSLACSDAFNPHHAYFNVDLSAVPVRLRDGYFYIAMWSHNAPRLPSPDDSTLSVCSQLEYSHLGQRSVF